jgi:hypothetical protein
MNPVEGWGSIRQVSSKHFKVPCQWGGRGSNPRPTDSALAVLNKSSEIRLFPSATGDSDVARFPTKICEFRSYPVHNR